MPGPISGRGRPQNDNRSLQVSAPPLAKPMHSTLHKPGENAFLDRFLTHCHRHRYPARTDIIHPGDPADTLYYIVEGSVSILMEDEEGHEIVLTYTNAG